MEDKEEIRHVLETAGHMALDAPLSGTGAQAQTGDLGVFASGDSATIASLMPMFAGFSREAHDLGAFGNGSRMKFVANLLVAINNVASAEAMVLAEKAGLDLRQVVKLVGAGAAQSRIFDLRAPMMADNHYLPATMRLSTWQKDMAVIGAFASASARLPRSSGRPSRSMTPPTGWTSATLTWRRCSACSRPCRA